MIAIILIIAAIAVPNLLRSKMAANEASAVGSVRTIGNAQALYQQTNPAVGYSADLTTLGQSSAGILDGQLAGGSKSGYNFTTAGSGGPPAGAFKTNADPVTRSSTGVRSFFQDESFVIRYNQAAAAAATDAALQ